jgi:transcription initiation factor TFIIB
MTTKEKRVKDHKEVEQDNQEEETESEKEEENSRVDDASERLDSKYECPECEDSKAIQDKEHGEVVCKSCGLVLSEDEIDEGPEWRAFDHQEREKKSRVGSPTTKTMHDKGLTTTIDWKDKDAYGKSISSNKRTQMNRLRKWQERIRTKDASERNLQFALSEIDRMASALGLPRQIRETSSVIYRQALDKDLIRGRSIEGVATASLYAACRVEKVPRSLEEVENVSRIDKNEVGRTYRYVSKEIGLELGPVDPKKYVPRFCSELELSQDVQEYANKIIDFTSEKGLLSGKSPTGFAAAAIYAAALLRNEKKTQREVSEVANVTEVTIRNRYQEQIEALKEEMSDE